MDPKMRRLSAGEGRVYLGKKHARAGRTTVSRAARNDRQGVEPERVDRESASVRLEMSTGEKTKILVVDDVPDRLVAMEALLEELGQEIVSVTSGREALRRLLNDDYAVILLDVNMPDLDGFETAALIRQRRRSEHTPIIFVTAFADEECASQGYSLGAVDYIQTPVIPEILRAKVRVFVELFQKNEQLKRQAAQQAALKELADRRAAQLRTMAAELANAEQRERRRLAQTLHDHIQQLLVAARMRVGRARSLMKVPEASEDLQEVDELLDQSISASRSLAIDLSPPVLNEAGLPAALEWLSRWTREKHGLEIEVRCDCEVPPISDEFRVTIFQAVRELLFNVVKHSGEKRAAISLRRDGDRWVRVVVEDRGVGFELPPSRDAARSEGMGLFSIRERIETLGGRCAIDSRPGRGTRVTLAAPVDFAATGSPADGIADRPGAAAGGGTLSASERVAEHSGKIRVMIVDDHMILRKGLRGMLNGQPDIEVVGEAADGHEAVAQASALSPDVIIMDINMPRLNGIEATRRIKQDQPWISIVGLSLHEDKEVAESMLNAGAANYVAKGGPPEELFEAVRAARSSQLAPT